MTHSKLLSKNNLILFLVVLAFLRFVVQPLAEHQGEVKNELRSNKQMIEKQQSMLFSDVNEDKVLSIEEDLNNLEQELLNFRTANNFQLDTQQRIEKIAEQENVSLDVFTWLDTEERVPGYLYNFSAQIEMSGQITNIVQVQLQMIQELGGVSVDEFSLRPSTFGAMRRGRFTNGAPQVRVSSVFNIGGVKSVESN